VSCQQKFAYAKDGARCGYWLRWTNNKNNTSSDRYTGRNRNWGRGIECHGRRKKESFEQK